MSYMSERIEAADRLRHGGIVEDGMEVYAVHLRRFGSSRGGNLTASKYAEVTGLMADLMDPTCCIETDTDGSRYCSICGADETEGAKYCPHCGCRVVSGDAD